STTAPAGLSHRRSRRLVWQHPRAPPPRRLWRGGCDPVPLWLILRPAVIRPSPTAPGPIAPGGAPGPRSDSTLHPTIVPTRSLHRSHTPPTPPSYPHLTPTQEVHPCQRF